jgi:hypothetical protein
MMSNKGTFPGRLLLLFTKLTFKNNTFFLFNDFNDWEDNEDAFWGRKTACFSWFTVPKWEEAVLFSVEVQPGRFIGETSELPFGCHAWWSYDLDFWKPHIERFGYKLK